MRKKLIEIGDNVLLKNDLLKEYNIPSEFRKAEVAFYDHPRVILYNKNWETPDNQLDGYFVDKIIIFKNINEEIYKILEADVEFVSFFGVTVDGKEIKIST